MCPWDDINKVPCKTVQSKELVELPPSWTKDGLKQPGWNFSWMAYLHICHHTHIHACSMPCRVSDAKLARFPQLVIQLTQQGHPTANPVLLWFVWGNLHGNDEVGGVAGGGEGTPPLARLVHWTLVGIGIWQFRPLAWLQPHLIRHMSHSCSNRQNCNALWNAFHRGHPPLLLTPAPIPFATSQSTLPITIPTLLIKNSDGN